MAFKIPVPHFGGGGKERQVTLEDVERAARVVQATKVDQDAQLVSFLVTEERLKTRGDLIGELNVLRPDASLADRLALADRIEGKRISSASQTQENNGSLS